MRKGYCRSYRPRPTPRPGAKVFVMPRQAIHNALRLIFEAIERLKTAFPNRSFSIDGRLVGDIGEVIAALEYDVVLDAVIQPSHDATTSDGRKVQIKATFQESLTFGTVPD